MEDNNNIKLSRPVPPFLRYCSATIPTAFDDSLSYYEALCALYKWLQTNVIDTINHNASVTNDFINKEKELEELFAQLKEYVDNYFDSLDVQEEINNKLDEMAEQGQLADIISQYLNSTAVFGYDTVADMKNAENLVNGSFACTLGYYAKNDGGGATYKIRNVTNDDAIDEGSIIEMNDAGNQLVAELISEDEINSKQFGVKADGTTDASTRLQLLFNYILNNNIKKVTISEGQYAIYSTVSADIMRFDIEATGANFINKINDGSPVLHLIGSAGGVIRHHLNGLRITNPDEIANAVGIQLGTDTHAEGTEETPSARFTIVNCGFSQLNKAIEVKHNAYIFVIEKCTAWMCNYDVYCILNTWNTGENIVIRDCLFTDYIRSINVESPNNQIRVHNTSFDAGQQVLYMNSLIGTNKGNMISFVDCHFEPKNPLTSPLIEFGNNDISKLNIVRATSFINTDLEALIVTNNSDQQITIKDSFFTFNNTCAVKYFKSGAGDIIMENNIWEKRDLLIDNQHNMFFRPDFNYTTISGNKFTVSGLEQYPNKVAIFRDNTSWSDACERTSSTNATLTLDATIRPGSTGKSVKVDVTGTTDLRVCMLAENDNTYYKKGNVKVYIPQNVTGKMRVSAVYWNGTIVQRSERYVELDLSDCAVNEWITLNYAKWVIGDTTDAKFVGFTFDLQGVYKPTVPYSFYIADPVLQSI